MKKIYFLILLLSCLNLQAQDRYLDSQFGVSIQKDVEYGTNISVITGAPAAQSLKCDIYTPAGDTETNRPLVLVAHTGSFLPPLFNGGITGAKSDSTTVAICRELAQRGYVAVAFTYRAGWLPTSLDQNQRTGTLLNAAYRGIQDSRSCIRYFRKTVATDGNPYGIDPDKIGMVGVGTGSYIAYGAGSLYDFSEISTLEKFIDTQTAAPYVNEGLMGNIFGDNMTPLCLPNTPGYSSEIDFSFTIGGALGDESWIDGDSQEAAFAGAHCVNDIFAPYGDGPVIVPTTMEFVVNVSGNRTAIQKANEAGNNEVLNDPSVYLKYQEISDAQKLIQVDPFLSAEISMGQDHFYGFNLPFPQGSPWDWWDLPTLTAVVAATNAALGTTFDADALHASGLQTNPDMSAAKGHAYVDTIISFMVPRACLALNLGCNLPVDITEIEASQIGLSIYPVPVSNEFTISVDNDVTIDKIYVFSTDGRMVKGIAKINASSVILNREGLNTGIYFAQITTDKGIVMKEIVID